MPVIGLPDPGAFGMKANSGSLSRQTPSTFMESPPMAKKPTLTPEEARQEALKTALETIERKFGQGAVMKLSDDVHVKVPVIPTGSIGVDLALGIGGIPKGRVTEMLRPRILGQNDPHPARHRGMPEARRDRRLHRRRARAGPGLRQSALGVNTDELLRLAARPRTSRPWKSADSAGPLRRGGPRGHRLRGRPCAPGRTRRRRWATAHVGAARPA